MLILLSAGLTWSSLIVAVVIVALWEGAVWFFLRRSPRSHGEGPGAVRPVPSSPRPDAAPLAAGGRPRETWLPRGGPVRRPGHRP